MYVFNIYLVSALLRGFSEALKGCSESGRVKVDEFMIYLQMLAKAAAAWANTSEFPNTWAATAADLTIIFPPIDNSTHWNVQFNGTGQTTQT